MAIHHVAAVAVSVCLLLAAGSAAESVPYGRVTSGWRHTHTAPPPHARMPITVMIKHDSSQYQALLDTCQSVSTPGTSAYGAYKTRSEVTALAGSAERVEAVTAWLDAIGASDVTACATLDCVHATVPVAGIAAEIGVRVGAGTGDLAVWMSPAGVPAVRTSVMPLVLPTSISDHVALVLGINDFPPPRPSRKRGASGMDGVVSVGDSPVTINEPGVALFSLDGPGLFAALTQTCPTGVAPTCAGGVDPVVGYRVQLQVYGAASPTYVNLNSSQLVYPGNNAVVIQAHDVLQSYKFYSQLAIAAVGQSGNTSAYQSVTAAIKSTPAGFRGILSTPAMNPTEIASFYGLPDVAARDLITAAGASQGVAEFGPDEGLLMTDLDKYRSMFGLANATKVTVVDYPSNPITVPGLESTMDIELIMAVAPGVATNFFVGPWNNTVKHAWVLDYLSWVASADSPPLVNSISYGLPESILPLSFGDVDYASRTNSELLKLCARGITVVTCSQDAGATDNGHGTSTCAIEPVFPGSSPYVTSVGATIKSPDAPARATNWGVGEAAISLTTGGIYTTGGGFSNLESCQRPWYQKSAVEAYTSAAPMPPAGTYNTTGRGYPDVAAVGRNYPIVLHGYLAPIGDGTSSSTPVWAGIISLMNAQRLAAGKPAIGFANPLLYKLAEADDKTGSHNFYDVTVGSNYCGAFLCCAESDGYVAFKGWDATTGLGSLGDYKSFLAAVMAA